MDKNLVIPFFIPHAGCPFTCVFCNQWEISGEDQEANPEEILTKVKEYLHTVKKKPERTEVAFFGGSFTGLPVSVQESYLKGAFHAKEEGLIDGIRLSTRPDYISDEIVERLCRYGVTTIELGCQSLVDEVLLKTKRGHDVEDIMKATEIIRKYPTELGYQLMLGLPGDNFTHARDTARKTIEAKPDCVRIYPALVLKNTVLAQWYEQGRYEPWNLENAVEMAAEWLGAFTYYEIKVIRMGLQATENLTPEKDLVAGPYHPAFGELVESKLMLQQLTALLSSKSLQGEEATIFFNPRDCSKVIGQKRKNIQVIKEHFGFLHIRLMPDHDLPENDLRVQVECEIMTSTRQEFLKQYRNNKWY